MTNDRESSAGDRNSGACIAVESIHAMANGVEPSQGEREHLASCAACSTALEHARRDVELERELAAAVKPRPAVATQRAHAAPLTPGTRVGGFTIAGELGVGGMGVVYRATQDSPRRDVALKVLKQERASAAVLRRFVHEAAALALLQHPGIAQVYQSGAASINGVERAFMAMELVRGKPLDEHLRERSPPIRQRLALIAQVCDAVEHAHRRGVVHRDLKPANILVTEDGAPKVLDFGVAKLSESPEGFGGTIQATQAGAFIGTIAYASPEQVSGDPTLIDAGTDVYALGVIAYRAVTGHHPYPLEGPLLEVVERIRAARIVDPRERVARMDADLAIIVRTALAADPQRRYQSAALFAEDLRRYLDKRPIRARPDSAVYFVRKALARNPLIAGAGAVVLAAVIGAGVLAVRAAQAERAKAGVTEAALGALAMVNPDEPDTPLIPDLAAYLQESGRIVERTLADQPDERDRMLTRLGQAMRGQRDLAAAARIFETLVERRASRGETDSLEAAELLLELGRTLWMQGYFEPAHAKLTRALDIRDAKLGRLDPRTVEARYWVGVALHGWRRYDQAESYFRAAIDDQRKIDDGALELGEYLTALAATVRGQGRYEEALEWANLALGHVRKVRGLEAKSLTAPMSNVIANLISLKRFDEAQLLLDQALRLRAKWYGDEDSRVADTRVQLGVLKMRKADQIGPHAEPTYSVLLIEGAEQAVRTLELRRRVYPGDHESVAEALSLLGQLLMRQGCFAEAMRHLTDALDMRERLPRRSQGNLARSAVNLGECLHRAGASHDHGRAEHLMRRGLDGLIIEYGLHHQFTRDAANRLYQLLQDTARPASAWALKELMLEPVQADAAGNG